MMTFLKVPSLSGGEGHRLDRIDGKWRCDCQRFAGASATHKECRHTMIAQAVSAAIERCQSLGHEATQTGVGRGLVASERTFPALCVPCLVSLVSAMTKKVKEEYVQKKPCEMCQKKTINTCRRCKGTFCPRCSRKPHPIPGSVGGGGGMITCGSLPSQQKKPDNRPIRGRRAWACPGCDGRQTEQQALGPKKRLCQSCGSTLVKLEDGTVQKEESSGS